MKMDKRIQKETRGDEGKRKETKEMKRDEGIRKETKGYEKN